MGAKRTEKAVVEQEAIARLLSPLGNISSRTQFGGYGVFIEGKMFALVSADGVLHFKVDGSNRADYKDGDRFGRMRYYRVPARVRKNTGLLRGWAKKSIGIALG